MPPPNRSDAGPEPNPRAVTIDAELAGRLITALEMIGTAFALDEVNDDRTLALISRLAAQGSDGPRSGETTDPARARAARDYDVLRGLLGRAGAPQPLRMHRETSRGGVAVYVVMDDALPVSARVAVVDSPGNRTSGPLTEYIEVSGGSGPPTRLTLREISPAMSISRIELLDRREALVAFGPSLPPTP